MIHHLREALPYEGCGLLAGRQGQVERVYTITNRLQSPTAFEMDPTEQVQAMLGLEADNLEMLAIYHSHPCAPASPSYADVSQAYYPGVAHVIVSWAEPERPQARVFTIVDGIVAEIDLKIV